MKKVRKKERKTPPRPKLGKTTESRVIQFINQHPPKRLSTNLRTMLLDFLMFEGAAESPYLQDLLYDLGGLFALLDTMENEG